MPAMRSRTLSVSLCRVSFYVLLIAGGLAGCGKTGPLYLPDEQTSALSGDIPVAADYTILNNKS
ncbi:hypothetical protein MNBD_GAMMA11-1295 [hydrothermal vent metagenome]|uniref:Lipoprotein n=1 Tax=hydrothermal vent metagenome TaxID=652676 RepID=A0A3B0WVL6_9ZZZZ